MIQVVFHLSHCLTWMCCSDGPLCSFHIEHITLCIYVAFIYWDPCWGSVHLDNTHDHHTDIQKILTSQVYTKKYILRTAQWLSLNLFSLTLLKNLDIHTQHIITLPNIFSSPTKNNSLRLYPFPHCPCKFHVVFQCYMVSFLFWPVSAGGIGGWGGVFYFSSLSLKVVVSVV